MPWRHHDQRVNVVKRVVCLRRIDFVPLLISNGSGSVAMSITVHPITEKHIIRNITRNVVEMGESMRSAGWRSSKKGVSLSAPLPRRRAI